MTGDRTMGRVGRSKTGGDSSTGLGQQGGGRKRAKALGVLLAVLACLVAGAVLLFGRSTAPDWPPSNWAMVVCDVGQGDAILLAAGSHTAVVVDTGPDPAAENRCLKQFQITTIPILILTHFHADHIGGLSAALADAHVGEIETTTVDDPPAGAAEVRREAAAAGVPVHRVTPHEQRGFGPVSWRVLWPDPAFPLGPDSNAPEDIMPGMNGIAGIGGMGGMSGGGSSGAESPGPNNSSIVMAVTIRSSASPSAGPDLRILLTGDIEQPVQADLLAVDRPALRADILKVPHHGSANQDPEFVQAVDPAVSIISVGAGNPYGHPVARTVHLMGSTGARLYRTDRDGAVVVGRADSADRDGTGFAVAASHGNGQPPATGDTPGDGDSDFPPRRSEHHYQKGHAHHHSSE